MVGEFKIIDLAEKHGKVSIRFRWRMVGERANQAFTATNQGSFQSAFAGEWLKRLCHKLRQFGDIMGFNPRSLENG